MNPFAQNTQLTKASRAPVVADWSKLPNELKHMILENYLTFPNTIMHKQHRTFFAMRGLLLLFTDDMEFTELVKKAYYGGNVFGIVPEVTHNHLPPALRIGHYIQHFEISLLSPDRHWHILDYPWDYSRILEDNVPNLKSLQIVLKVADSPISYLDHLFDKKSDSSLVKQIREVYKASIAPFARKPGFSFKIVSTSCPFLRPNHTGGICTCAKSAEDRVIAEIMAP